MDYENKDYFEFKAQMGGYFPFSGVIDNNKQISRIDVDREHSVASITYTDGWKFTVRANITDVNNDGQVFIINNIRKEWSKRGRK